MYNEDESRKCQFITFFRLIARLALLFLTPESCGSHFSSQVYSGLFLSEMVCEFCQQSFCRHIQQQLFSDIILQAEGISQAHQRGKIMLETFSAENTSLLKTFSPVKDEAET